MVRPLHSRKRPYHCGVADIMLIDIIGSRHQEHDYCAEQPYTALSTGPNGSAVYTGPAGVLLRSLGFTGGGKDMVYHPAADRFTFGSDPHCPRCGREAEASADATADDEAGAGALSDDWFDGRDYYCLSCKHCFWSDEAFGDEPDRLPVASSACAGSVSGRVISFSTAQLVSIFRS